MNQISLRYTGQRISSISEKYMLGKGYRGFNPVLKRFTVQDNMSPFGAGGPHGFAYCSGDPVNNTDPSGHVFKWLWALLGIDGGKKAAKKTGTVAATSMIRIGEDSAVAGVAGDATADVTGISSTVAEGASEMTGVAGNATPGVSGSAGDTLIGYHGTSKKGAAGILATGPKDSNFFVTSEYEFAGKYAQQNGRVLRVTTDDAELVRQHSYFNFRNASGVDELRIDKSAYSALKFSEVSAGNGIVDFSEKFVPYDQYMQRTIEQLRQLHPEWYH